MTTGRNDDLGELSYQGTPRTVEQKHELAQMIDGLVPGDEVTLECPDATRLATVEREIEEYDDTPDWTPLCLGAGDVGYVLSGHGTEYLLTADVESKEPLLPRLEFPSEDLFAIVFWMEFRDRGDQITSERTAGDLLWRIQRYDGR